VANTWTNFYPTLFSDIAFESFASASIAPQVTNLTWVDPGGPALAVRIPKFSFSTAGITTISALKDSPSGVTESTLVLNLDQEQGFFFEIEYTEQDKANVALGESVLRQRTAALAAVIDQDIFGIVSGVAQVLSGAVNKATLVSAIELLNEANAPQTDRVLVVNPDGYSDLLNTNDFVRNDSIAGATANRTGFVGMALGLDVYLSNNLPTVSGYGLDAVVMHRTAIAMAMLRQIEVKIFDQPRHFTTGYTGRATWGKARIEDALIVAIDRP
jgi:hypothetical protein